jgi:hypothetical protein
MFSFIGESTWQLRQLRDANRNPVLAFLEREPLLNVYLISRVLDDGLSVGHNVEVRHHEATVLIASLAGNLVLAGASGCSATELTPPIRMVADRIFGSMLPVRAIISDAALVDILWGFLTPRIDPPTVIRFNQPVYAIGRHSAVFPELEQMRYAELADLDLLVPACAAMHHEEVGINPMDRDAAGYRQRIRELVVKRRALVRIEGGRILFKCEFSAVTPAAVQLMGVWTDPHERRHGYAREGMREVCGHIFRQRKDVTLFVNDFNRPAIDLYESLGFRKIGMNRAMIW